MSNKKNEDIEMRANDGQEFGGEKDPFLSRANSHRGRSDPSPVAVGAFIDKIDHSPGASILAYCLASISMTVVNKYVVSGSEWNLMFFYLAVQVCFCNALPGATRWAGTNMRVKSIVCTLAILAFKQLGLFHNLAPFDTTKAKKCMFYFRKDLAAGWLMRFVQGFPSRSSSLA
jgi:GDP-mannose transporter